MTILRPARRALLPWLGMTLLSTVAHAQDVSRVAVTRPVRVDGLAVDARVEDRLGLGRTKFHGRIAAELASVGYRVVDASSERLAASDEPLTLVGTVKEEICDDDAPVQCRIAVQWELQDVRGAVVYRATTRAVNQSSAFEDLRRDLVEAATRSLMTRRRFVLQFKGAGEKVAPSRSTPLGFKACRRPLLELPRSSRAAATAVVLVESGSKLAGGVIVSPDGLVLTSASALSEDAPLRVRFSAQQVLPAEIVALDRGVGAALVHVQANTDAACLRLAAGQVSVGLPVYGVSTELAEGNAISLSGGSVLTLRPTGSGPELGVDSSLMRTPGAPLLDGTAGLVGVVVAAGENGRPLKALGAADALHALGAEPAALTDPRLLASERGSEVQLALVRDRDDPPFQLTKRYTYGTSSTAHSVRRVGSVTLGVGAATVIGSWFLYRGTQNPSPSEHRRSVIWNDIGWALFGVGAVGVGASFVLPEAHDRVAVQSASRRDLYVRVAGSNLAVGLHL